MKSWKSHFPTKQSPLKNTSKLFTRRRSWKHRRLPLKTQQNILEGKMVLEFVICSQEIMPDTRTHADTNSHTNCKGYLNICLWIFLCVCSCVRRCICRCPYCWPCMCVFVCYSILIRKGTFSGNNDLSLVRVPSTGTVHFKYRERERDQSGEYQETQLTTEFRET